MSDRAQDLANEYRVVVRNHSGRNGLSSIPEDSARDGGSKGMWSSVLDSIFTALRYLAPATLLTFFWGNQGLLFKILKFIDVSLRSIVFSSDKQKESVLAWLAESSPVEVDRLDTVWSHGWIICSVLDAALPGACAGHSPTKLSLKHAQTIADHYLGVEPVFTAQELENDSLSRHQEWKLALYLERIREALARIPPPVSQPGSQRTSPDASQFTLDYAARGGGLTAAQVNNKMFFKIYPTAQQSLEPGDITILIKGPKDTYGLQILPPIFGKAQLIRQKILRLNKEPHYTKSVLPITQGATYLRAYGKTDIKKTYHIPKTRYDIEIDVDSDNECAKVGYVVRLEGKYEISIISRGQHIVGSPYTVTASNNILPSLERESFCLEDGEVIDIVDEKNNRKVVLRIVDFVTEKMLLKEDGVLEKISDSEAKILISTGAKEDSEHTNTATRASVADLEDYDKKQKLKEVVEKLKVMIRVCKVLRHTLQNAHRKTKLGIPDIVNSTLSDSESYSKKSKTIQALTEDSQKNLQAEKEKRYRQQNTETISENDMDEDSLNNKNETDLLNSKMLSLSNPFLHELQQKSVVTEQDIEFYSAPASGIFRSIDSNEESDQAPIKIVIEEDTESPSNSSPNNPFIEPEILERPKTPILKIISGEVKDRSDSVYVDSTTEFINEEVLKHNEFINPFFVHRQDSMEINNDLITDFIIGAPVSLPPLIKASTPEPQIDSILITAESEQLSTIDTNENIKKEYIPSFTREMSLSTSSPFHSIDSNMQESVEEDVIVKSENVSNRPDLSRVNYTPKRDIWDSAYVSIDDSSNSPDRNNNDSPTHAKLSPADDWAFKHGYSNLGPAEKELWKSCTELSNRVTKKLEDQRPPKWESRVNTFTPIQEENDRCISVGFNDSQDNDPVTLAFAELQDIFKQYTNESNSLQTFDDDKSTTSTEVNYTFQMDQIKVNSASALVADVTRPATKKTEGQISAVQSFCIESGSVSQSLQDEKKKFCVSAEENFSNIVLEKKKFWDKKIRELEEINNEEQKKKKILTKPLKCDSLSKRKGRQIVKNILAAGEDLQAIVTTRKAHANNDLPMLPNMSKEEKIEPKLVHKWKKFWNERLENSEDTPAAASTSLKYKKANEIKTDKANKCIYTAKIINEHVTKLAPNEITSQINSAVKCDLNFETPMKGWESSSKKIIKLDDLERSGSIPKNRNNEDSIDAILQKTYTTIKQHVPEEAMFHAFETSPKRFFGSSRKQIFSKIDAYLGKPNSDTADPPSELTTTSEKGIVSSRINLFHSIKPSEDTKQKDTGKWSRDSSEDTEKEPKTAKKEIKDILVRDKVRVLKEETIKREKSTDYTSSKSINQIRRGVFAKSKTSNVDITPTKNLTAEKDKCSEIKDYQKYSTDKIETQSVDIPEVTSQLPLRKSSFSKSEMDIFTKTISLSQHKETSEKYKSYDELPKVNVKSFISIYETATKAAHAEPKIIRKSSRTNSLASEIQAQTLSPEKESYKSPTAPLPKNYNEITSLKEKLDAEPPKAPPRKRRESKYSSQESLTRDQNMDSIEEQDITVEATSQKENDKSYVSLSEMEIEIIDRSIDLTPERETDPTDYKSRFHVAKQYFQSLEELRAEDTKPCKVNECEMLLKSGSIEKQEIRPKQRVKKNIKSNSMPSSELCEIWNQLHEKQKDEQFNNEGNKLVKISEKFNVDDLFHDVVEGKLSRQGSLRGIPHKKAVLETFKSMENISDSKISPYEIATSQLRDFAKQNNIKNAQTYLTEYPYLPTTNPARYHSRLDARASGLISMKELMNAKPRRNSVPEMVLQSSFSVDV